jgi:hypothetical protein
MPAADPTSDPVARALAAYEELIALAEDVDDEWGYIQDLSQAWRTELERAGGVLGAADAGPVAVAAIDRLVDEVGHITDAHRAIDWLSTFPQAVLLALGLDPWGSAA